MKKKSVIIGVFGLCVMLACATNQTIIVSSFSPSPCLADDLLFDFSETNFFFVDPLESWFVFKFKVTNMGTNSLLLGSRCSCNVGDEAVGLPLLAPQGETPLEPGESMWIKILPAGGEGCGYDPNVLQTVTRTFHIEIQDNDANYDPWEANQVTTEKEIQIEVVNRETLEGDILLQGVVVDGQGSPIPYAQIDIGGYGANLPMACDDDGCFSYSIAQTSAYFLTAYKEGYRPTTIEVDGSDVQDFYTITLENEPSPLSISSSLMNTIEGNIGFWRCAATADESKLLLVNGMENWENESLKNQSKLYLLDTSTGEVLWTHDMGWESWSADISDDGRYVVFGTKLEGFQTGPEGFVNYIRLVDGENGTTLWQKEITTENFPCTTHGEFYTRGVKFSHSGEYIFVPIHCEYGYLLNSADGSLLWCKWVGANIREVIFTQDDQYVYVPSGAGWLYKLRVNDASEVWKQWIGTWAYVGGFDISSDEQHIAVGTKVGYLTVINTADGSIRFSMDIHNGHAHCRFSPDGTKVAVGGEGLMMLDLDGNLLWRYVSGGMIDIRFSGDGSFITVEDGVVFDVYGMPIHDITSGELPPGYYNQVSWLNSEGTRFICALRDTPASGREIIGVYSIETSVDTTPPLIGAHSQDPQDADVLANQMVIVSVDVTDTQTGVCEVILSYSTDQGTTWTNTTMNMTNGDTYVGQIPGFPEGAEVQYMIIAYDNAENYAISDNTEQYYIYTVIPEFPSATILSLFVIITLLVTILVNKKRKADPQPVHHQFMF